MRPGHDLFCRQCGIAFFVCSSCFRRQIYCSSRCRQIGYEERRRVARKKYAATPEARADHRDRNKLYIVYGRQGPIVMDKSSDKGPVDIPSADIRSGCILCGVKE